MKPKKFNHLLAVMEIFDDCQSVVQQLKSSVINGENYEQSRIDMLEILEKDLKRLHIKILKL